jgi:hypothetical protein
MAEEVAVETPMATDSHSEGSPESGARAAVGKVADKILGGGAEDLPSQGDPAAETEAPEAEGAEGENAAEQQEQTPVDFPRPLLVKAIRAGLSEEDIDDCQTERELTLKVNMAERYAKQGAGLGQQRQQTQQQQQRPQAPQFQARKLTAEERALVGDPQVADMLDKINEAHTQQQKQMYEHLMQQVQSANQRVEVSEQREAVKVADGFFVKDKELFGDKPKGQMDQGTKEWANRIRVIGEAQKLMRADGALDVEKALEQAKLLCFPERLATQTRQKIAADVNKRRAMVTPRPTHRETTPIKKAPEEAAMDAARAKARELGIGS